MKYIMRFFTAVAILAFVVVASIVLSDWTEPVTTKLASQITNFVLYGNYKEHILDSNGVPKVRYRRVKGMLFYNPVYVAVYGLYYYDKWLDNGENEYFLKYYNIYPPNVSKPEEWLKYFINTADWLAASQKVYTFNNDIVYGVYEYNFPWEVYNLRPPWRSAMAQSLSAQVLLRAWLLTGNEKYRKAMDLALNALYVPVSSGGVTIMSTDDSWWYEEYASTAAIESRVLNGMEHVLIALFEAASITSNPNLWMLFKNGNNSLEKIINKYSANNISWTFYDAVGRLANYKYHMINIALTKKLLSITGNNTYKIYAVWEEMRSPYFVREFIYQRPGPIDIATWLLNVLIVLAVITIISVFYKIGRR